MIEALGRLIVFEGIDGSGKSTQFDLLCDRLSGEGTDFVRLRFPRYSEPSSALIRMYLGGDFGDDPDAVNAYAASSFFAVDRYASFMQDWRRNYEGDTMILTDRYTTSNAIHQGAKLTPERRGHFFAWLYEYEFRLLGLPEPDLVFFMDIDSKLATKRLERRQADTGTVGDIHEKDLLFLDSCSLSGRQAAAHYGWHKINCFLDGNERSIEEIHNEIYTVLKHV